MKKGLLILGVVTVLATALLYVKKTADLAKKLCYKVTGYSLIKFGLKSTTIEVVLQVKNLGQLNLGVRRLVVDVYANGVYISKIRHDSTARIAPLGTADLPLRITFSPSDILKNIGGILRGAGSLENIKFDFSGKISVLVAGVPMPVPFDISATVAQMKGDGGGKPC